MDWCPKYELLCHNLIRLDFTKLIRPMHTVLWLWILEVKASYTEVFPWNTDYYDIHGVFNYKYYQYFYYYFYFIIVIIIIIIIIIIIFPCNMGKLMVK